MNFDGIGVLLRVVNFLQSTEAPIIFFILKVIELNQITALDEVFGCIEVI